MRKTIFLFLAIFGIAGCRNSVISSSDGDNPYIMEWSIPEDAGINLKITGGTPYTGQALSPSIGQSINANYPYGYVLFSSLDVEIWSGPNGGGQLLGKTTINMVTKDGNTYPLDANNLIKLAYNPSKSSYPGKNPPWDSRNWFDVTFNGVPSPSVITNNGWSNGLGNQDAVATSGESFFVADYGDESGRWTVIDGAIYQDTENRGAAGSFKGNSGSRIYAVQLNEGSDSWTYDKGIGVAKDGLWQIDIRIGSNGGGDFCETFYLSERRVLAAGVPNYMDGNKTNPTVPPGREIDVMETKWKQGGPQISLANDEGGTYWNTDSAQNVQMGNWSDVGGAPNPDFVTYGVLIRDNNLWIYAYKPDGTQWYSTGAIPNTNTTYDQEGDFVAYIGTWGPNGESGGFKTGYNNFIYLPQDDPKILGKNPLDNPEAFGGKLLEIQEKSGCCTSR
jgi:hypothetical protein